MTRTVYAKHEPYWDTGHLGHVVGEMQVVGRPTIRCAVEGDEIFTLEGSHRTCAAHYLGETPCFVILPDETTGTESFWSSIRDRLPSYEFPEVLLLDLNVFLPLLEDE